MTAIAPPMVRAPRPARPTTAPRRLGRRCVLTPAELRVLTLLAEGRSYESIAEEIGRAQSTVRSQLQSAYRRLGVRTSYQAVLKCVRNGWIGLDGCDTPNETSLERVSDLLAHLVDAVQTRRESDSLTQNQRRYLAAFDSRLRARSTAAQRACRQAMDVALADVLREAEIPGDGQPLIVDELGELAIRHIDHALARS